MAQVVLRPTRRRRRPFVVLCMVSPIVFCFGWTALWLVAQREAARVMDRWMIGEADLRRIWTCPKRDITGFPLELRVVCSEPSLHGLLGGETVDVEAASLAVSVQIYQPNAIDAVVGSPVKIARVGQDDPTIVSWSAFSLEVRILPDAKARVAVLLDDVALDHQGVDSKAGHIELRFAPRPASASQDQAYEVWFQADRASLPPLDAATGETAPLSIDEKGVLTKIEPSTIEPWPVLAEAWRQAGGTFELAALKVSKGDFRAEAQGKLDLDDAHRLAGRLQTALWGYESLAMRFGVSPRALSVGNALSKILGHAGAKASADPPAITLPLAFADGRVRIGPVVTPQRLNPLY